MSDLLTPLQRLKTRAIALGLAPAIGALCRTLTWTVEGAEHYDAVQRSGQQPIVVFWHARILPITWFFRNRGIVALTSANFDGQWIARVIERLGNHTVAGSSSRGGMRGLLRLRREIENGRPVAFALDGPRGPARVAQPGALWLAAHTGHPILPVHAESSAVWELASWDRTHIPKPLARTALVVGAPFVVPGEAPPGDEARRDLEARLAQCEFRARAQLT